jgi:rubrerythrin
MTAMSGRHWTLEDIPWQDFDSARVDPELVKIVKAASLVEYNGGEYATYLCNIFPDDPEFKAAAATWAGEEVQHGRALARWARLADPSFDFEDAFRRFTEGYKLPLGAAGSVRGSRAGELVARCIVEVGTSSYYSALGSAASEPVLRAICRNIAADELRHYKLFYSHLKRYLKKDRVGRWRRVAIALSRINEAEDDELSYAYYAANGGGEAYDRERWCRAYMRRAYAFYRPHHIERAVAMTFKAAGLNPQSRLAGWASRLAYRLVKWRGARLAAAGA